MTLNHFRDPEACRELLSRRSVLDKIGIPVRHEDTGMTSDQHQRFLLALSELVTGGILEWMDRARVTVYEIDCHIYKLTPMGITLCDDLGIQQH